MPKGETQSTLPMHGASVLPSVVIDSYNLELEEKGGFVGDKASKSAFSALLDDVRETLLENGDDPFGDTPTEDIGKKKLDAVLCEGEPEATAAVLTAIESFAQQLAGVLRRYMRLKSWRDTESIVVGGGFSASRVGVVAVSRASIILKAEGLDVHLTPILNHPDEAGLIGGVHLLPAWMLAGHDAMLAVDIGGSNIRCGIVEFNIGKSKDLSKACVADMKLWRHREEDDLKRDEAVNELTKMLRSLAKDCKGLAPIVGVGCPGVIEADGTIDRGAQNLPGNWESGKFNLPLRIREALADVGDGDISVVMHNDAVVQGLSELPRMQDLKHWGVLTIGTGLGNARFTNRKGS